MNLPNKKIDDAIVSKYMGRVNWNSEVGMRNAEKMKQKSTGRRK